MGAFGAEIAIIILSYLVNGIVIETSFLFLTGMTAVAMLLFLVEGILLYRKITPNHR
jgi:hypothetical protein